jgi:argininosuccinate lyase
VAELVRGKSGRVFGNLMGLLTVMKGLPLAYDSDMQEDKEATFEVVDTLEAVLEVAAGMMRTLKVDRQRIAARLGQDYTAATDLADLLVEQGMPFREAHHRVGALVRELSARGLRFSDVDGALLNQLGMSDLRAEWFANLTPTRLVERRRQPFATAPAAVAAALTQARRRWQATGAAATGSKGGAGDGL